MFPPPGYGLSDVALVARWAADIRRAYSEAPARYRQLALEGSTLEDAVGEIACSFPYEELSGQQQVRLQHLTAHCNQLLEKVWRIYEKYSSLQTKQQNPWDRLVFGNEDITGLVGQMKSIYVHLDRFRVQLIEYVLSPAFPTLIRMGC
jgi:hypothetical protein